MFLILLRVLFILRSNFVFVTCGASFFLIFLKADGCDMSAGRKPDCGFCLRMSIVYLCRKENDAGYFQIVSGF